MASKTRKTAVFDDFHCFGGPLDSVGVAVARGSQGGADLSELPRFRNEIADEFNLRRSL